MNSDKLCSLLSDQGDAIFPIKLQSEEIEIELESDSRLKQATSYPKFFPLSAIIFMNKFWPSNCPNLQQCQKLKNLIMSPLTNRMDPTMWRKKQDVLKHKSSVSQIGQSGAYHQLSNLFLLSVWFPSLLSFISNYFRRNLS